MISIGMWYDSFTYFGCYLFWILSHGLLLPSQTEETQPLGFSASIVADLVIVTKCVGINASSGAESTAKYSPQRKDKCFHKIAEQKY